MAVFVFQPIIISLIMRVQYIHNGFYTYSNMRMPITILYYNKKMAATMDPRARIYVRTYVVQLAFGHGVRLCPYIDLSIMSTHHW